MSKRDQQWFAERFYSGVARAQKTGLAEMIDIDPAHTAKPCCDSWVVKLYLYWPERIWIWRCDSCNVIWTEGAVKKSRGNARKSETTTKLRMDVHRVSAE